MEEVHKNDQDKVRLDPEKLTERELDEIAYLVVRKLREAMRQERDRYGRY